MKKLYLGFIFAMCILFNTMQAQGDVSTPYSIEGWDNPIEFTTHYQLPVYRLLSNPGGWINRSQTKVDSLFNALIVLTDSTQLQIRNDVLIHSTYMSGQAQFEPNAVWDTVQVAGLDSMDIVIVTTREGANNEAKAFIVTAVTDSFYVGVPSGSVAGVKYNWMYIRKYQ